ncbi:hypothetical protein [Mucilaginibacter rubeus]|uniref:hypothetical protein n=1 Tax=Mucilaginibacter rubeus TaxID=2027860 RepID=UPI00166EE95B|nr:hypothetical protein [Mucilaginibacter rubeus]
MEQASVNEKRSVAALGYSIYLMEQGITFSHTPPYLISGALTGPESWLIHLSIVSQQFDSYIRPILDFLKSEGLPLAIPADAVQHNSILGGTGGFQFTGKVISVRVSRTNDLTRITEKMRDLTRHCRFWSHAALLFTLPYATYVILMYWVQLATVIPESLRDPRETTLTVKPHSIFWTLDALGFICMGSSTFLAALRWKRATGKLAGCAAFYWPTACLFLPAFFHLSAVHRFALAGHRAGVDAGDGDVSMDDTG